MRMITLAATALMCSASALAQTGTAAQPGTTQNQGATDPSSAPTSNQTMSQDQASPSTATSTEPTSGSTSAGASMSSQGSADMASYDSNKDGALSPLEFGQHVVAMNGANASLSAEAKRERFSRASGNGAIKLLNDTADDFSKADQNRDRRVDSSELAMFHSRGMSAGAGASAAPTSGAGSMSAAPSTDTSATMNSSAPDSPDDSSTATETGETDPANANSSATVPPDEPK